MQLAMEASRRSDFATAIVHARRLVSLRPSVQSHRELAYLLEIVDDWEGALGEYQEGLRLDSEHPALTRGAAIAYVVLNQPAKAVPLLEQLLQRYPDDSQSQIGLARAREMLAESSTSTGGDSDSDSGSAPPTPSGSQ